MKIFRFLLLLCLPAFLLSPIPSCAFESKASHLETGQKLFIPRDDNGLINPWGYFNPLIILSHLDGYVDHVFGFIDLLTDVDFLESLCEEEAERLIDFVIFMVRFSVPKSRPDLTEKYEQEIEELLDLMHEDVDDEYELSSNHDFHWEFVPAVCYEKPEFLLCKKKKKKDKGYFERKWHHFTHWVDKNKVPLIMGGAAVGVLGIAYLAGGGGASTVVAVGGALAGVIAEDELPPPHINKPGKVRFRDDPPAHVSPNDSISILPSRDFQPPEQIVPISEPSQILDEAPLIVQESIEEIKEELAEENISEKGTVKDFASYMTHQILDDVSDYGLKHVVGEETIEAGHELIDRAFGTDYASEYTEEFKEAIASLKKELGMEIAIGALPPPTAPAGAVARTGAAIASAVVAQEVISGASVTGGSLTTVETNSQSILENQIRNNLIAKGYNPPDRPKGIPDDWKVQESDKNGGVKYNLEVLRKNGTPYPKAEVRVMPANPNSPKSGQQRPYVKHRVENKFYDKDGNVVQEDSYEAHIAWEEYDFEKISAKAQK